MFTGIVQAVGKVREPEKLGNGVRLTILAPDLGLNEVKVGDSIAVNGACMTVIEVGEREFKIDVRPHRRSVRRRLSEDGAIRISDAHPRAVSPERAAKTARKLPDAVRRREASIVLSKFNPSKDRKARWRKNRRSRVRRSTWRW